MRVSRFVGLLTTIANCGLLSIRSAEAQEHGKTAITMGYPASVGLIFHLTDRVAIRPELSFSTSDSDSNVPLAVTTSESSTLGVGASGIFYLRRWDKLRTYVSPRYVYGRSSLTIQSAITPDNPQTIDSHSVAGSFGAQFWMHDRFSVFGEVGIGYTRQRNTSALIDVRNTTNTVSTRTGVGVAFYF